MHAKGRHASDKACESLPVAAFAGFCALAFFPFVAFFSFVFSDFRCLAGSRSAGMDTVLTPGGSIIVGLRLVGAGGSFVGVGVVMSGGSASEALSIKSIGEGFGGGKDSGGDDGTSSCESHG